MWDRFKRRPLLTYFLYRGLALTWAFAPFQVYYLERHGLSVTDVFDLNVVFSISAVALEIPTGIFADRHGRRLAMSAGAFVMSLACALFVLGGGFWTYALANALCALSMTLASGADSAYLFDHLEENRLSGTYARLEGWSTSAKGLGNVGAVLIGALIYQFILPEGVFVFTGLTTAFAGVLALCLPERRPTNDVVAKDHLLRAVRTLAGDGRLIAVMMFGALSFVLLRLSLFADQPHLEAHLTGAWLTHTVLSMGLLAAAKEIATAVTAGSSGWLFARVPARVLTVGLAIFLVGAYALMGENRAPVCVTVMVLLASGFGVFSPLMRALMNRLIAGPRDRATLLSMEGMGRRLLFAATSPIFGRAVEASSLHAAFAGTAWAAGVSYAALGLGALMVFRAATSARRVPAASPSALASAAG